MRFMMVAILALTIAGCASQSGGGFQDAALTGPIEDGRLERMKLINDIEGVAVNETNGDAVAELQGTAVSENEGIAVREVEQPAPAETPAITYGAPRTRDFAPGEMNGIRIVTAQAASPFTKREKRKYEMGEDPNEAGTFLVGPASEFERRSSSN